MNVFTLRKLAMIMAVLLIISVMAACGTGGLDEPEQTDESLETTETGQNESPEAKDDSAPSGEDQPSPSDSLTINTEQDPVYTLGNDSLVMELPITDEPVTLSYFISGLSDVMPGILDTYADHIQFL